MTIKVGSNGFGRIGRNILRALYESGPTDEIRVVAINDLGDAETNAHLTRYDTAHGRFPSVVEVDGDALLVNGDRIAVLAERAPAKLPSGELGVDVVHECTGFFASKDKAGRHLEGGAPGGNRSLVYTDFGADMVDRLAEYGISLEMARPVEGPPGGHGKNAFVFLEEAATGAGEDGTAGDTMSRR